jgi:hypothetical protein
MRGAAALLSFLLPQLAHALVFSPSNRFNAVYDTWFHRDHRAADNASVWLLNFLTTHDPLPGIKGENIAWNAYASAVSSDGVRFADAGLALRRRCLGGDLPEDSPTCMENPAGIGQWPPTIQGIGSGSVWRLLKNKTKAASAGGNATGASEAEAEEDEWVMNYSQQHGNLSAADGREIAAAQSIFFARSSDLINWVPVNDLTNPSAQFIFTADPRWYHTQGVATMRWDTISALPRPGGGYYGYLTATPLTPTDKSKPSFCAIANTTGCGVGLAQSDDGLHWTSLESPGPNFVGEMGGVCQLSSGGRGRGGSNKTWMTFAGGHLVSSPSLTGPFTAEKVNYNFLTVPTAPGAHGHAPYDGAGYPRLWGETNTGDPNLCLITHGFGDYVGLVKRGLLGNDGVLRAGWWDANNNLKGRELTIHNQLPVNASTKPPPAAAAAPGMSTSCVRQCMTAGLWLEGTLPLTDSKSAAAAAAGDASSGGSSGSSSSSSSSSGSSSQQQPGLWMQTNSGSGWTSTIDTDTGVFTIEGHTIDRGPFLAAAAAADASAAGAAAGAAAAGAAAGKAGNTTSARWHALVRNSWTGHSIDKRGNVRMVQGTMMIEWYVEGVLADTVYTHSVATGGFAALGGATITAVHQLSLPESTPYIK